MNSWGILLIGILIVISAIWQIAVLRSVFEGGGAPAVLGPAALIGAVAIAGAVGYSIFGWIDGKPGFGLLETGKSFFWALLFAVLLLAISILGPVVLGINAAYSVYNYFEHGTLNMGPVMEWLVNLVFHSASRPIAVIFALFLLTVTAVFSGIAAALGES